MTQPTFYGVRSGKNGPLTAFYADREDADSHLCLSGRRSHVEPIQFTPDPRPNRYCVVSIEPHEWEPIDPLDSPQSVPLSGDFSDVERLSLDDATMEVDGLNRMSMDAEDYSVWSVVVELGTVLDEMVTFEPVTDDICVAHWSYRSAVRVLRFHDFSR